eukprot:NODE_17_length_48642_cov_1.199349.p27 type:complete len:212 gc:universal NODE_17_length_48642_cov_1.199349:13635-14270(+)
METFINHPNCKNVDVLYQFLKQYLNADSKDEFDYYGNSGKIVRWKNDVLLLIGQPVKTINVSSSTLSAITEKANSLEKSSLDNLLRSNRDIFENITKSINLESIVLSRNGDETLKDFPKSSLGFNDSDPLFINKHPLEDGGMIMGPNHSIFQSDRAREIPEGYLSPLSVPPGAKFDPIFPNDSSLGRNFKRSGEPNSDHFKPPNNLGNFDI